MGCNFSTLHIQHNKKLKQEQKNITNEILTMRSLIEKQHNNKTNKEFKNLIVCSFNIRLVQSANYLEKIDNLINFITSSDYNVVCLQGIHDINLLKIFAQKIFEHNVTSCNKLTTYPVLESIYPAARLSQQYKQRTHDDDNIVDDFTSADILKITWSNSYEEDISDIKSIIITKENIVSASKIKMQSVDSDYDECWMYVVNLEWNNKIVSVYNVTLEHDYVGISNIELRKCQLEELLGMINANIQHVTENEEYFSFGNTQNVSQINIVCCQSNIKELLNSDINNEYLYFTRSLKSLDTYRYVQTLKGKNISLPNDATDLSGSRNNYILLSMLNVDNFEILENIGKYLYNNYKLLIINSQIKEINLFEDYAVITHFIGENIHKHVDKLRRESIDNHTTEIL